MTKTEKLSEMLLEWIAEGYSVQQAFEKVFGPGSYRQFSNELYDALNSRAA